MTRCEADLSIQPDRRCRFAVAHDDPVRAWLSLPRRIYLDTSTL